jgi:hypothetical protein
MSAIKAIIATQFDATGIKKASKEFNKLGSSLRSTLGAVGIGVGLAAISSGLKNAAKAAVEDSKSQGLLAKQLQNTTGATKGAIAANEAFISSLELTTSIADDQLRPAMATLVRATGDVGKAQGLLALSADVAAGTGRDLGSVSIAVAKAANGQTTALKRLGIVVKDGEDPIKALTDAFKGNAEAAANLDPFQRLDVIFGRIQEQIGFALLPTLQNFANWFASPEGSAQVQQFVDILVDAVTGLANFAKYVSDNIDFLGPLAIGIGIATVAFGLFNAVLAANPYVAAAYGLGLVVAGLVAVGAEAYKAKEEYDKLNGAKVRFGGGIVDKQKAALAKPVIKDNLNAGIAGRITAKNSKVVVDPLKDLYKEIPKISKVADTAKKLTDAALATAKKQADIVLEFTNNIMDLSKAFKELGQTSQDLGKFEQQAVDSFDAINQAIVQGLKDKAISQTAANLIYDYIKVERVALTALARQRDILLSKIAIAKDISKGVVDAVNITGLLSQETKSVTKTVTSLVGNIATTISSTYDEIITGNLAESFKKLVDKTKNFAKNLVNLKKLGLNGTLFKQIVDAGSEAGGATAEAIIAGGADTVKELNGLFDELNLAGSDIAQTSTDTFYALGEGVSNAFIDGLKSQEQYLADEIASMVASIEAAFASMMARLNSLQNGSMTNANGFAYSSDPFQGGTMESQFGSGTPWAQAVANYRSSQAAPTQVNVVVNAGIGTNGKAVGQQITSLLNQYTKANA